MDDDEYQKALSAMSANLDPIFDRMGSERRWKEVERREKLIQFTQDLGELQIRLIKSHQARKVDPPIVDSKWPSPQSVKQANKQYTPFTEFSEEKKKKIDETCRELVDLNKQMMEGLEKFLNDPKQAEDT